MECTGQYVLNQKCSKVFFKLLNTKKTSSEWEINKILIVLFCFLPQKCQGFHIFTIMSLTKKKNMQFYLIDFLLLSASPFY